MNDFISRDQIQAKDQKRAPLMKSSEYQMTLYKKILTKRN
jgi:hypothetical protein